MKPLSKTPAGEAHHNKEWCPALPRGLMCVSPSLSSYKDYPAHQPFIKTLHRPPPHMRQAALLTSPAKSFPESHSAEIISALRNLQEKIRRLELEKRRVDLGLQVEQPSTRPLVTSTQRRVDLGLQAEQPSTRPLVTSTQRRVDLGLQAEQPSTRPLVTSTQRPVDLGLQAEQPSTRPLVTSTQRRVDLGLQAEQPSTRPLVTSTQRPVDLGLQAEQPSTRPLVTSTQRPVDLGLQALGRAAPSISVSSTRRLAEPWSDVTSARREAELRSGVTSTRRQAEQPSDVTSTRRQAEQPSDVTSTRRQAEQPSDVTSTRRQAEQPSDVTSTRRQVEQPSDVSSDRREMRSEGASARPQCNQVLLTQLAAAEARCQQLERQLELMRRTVRLAQQDRTSLLWQQVSMATDQSGDQAPGPEHARLLPCDPSGDQAHCEKLERLEREYIRMTLTQNQAEKKIHELEEKLEEEERQRKLVQEKADLLQTGLEANRTLLQSVAPRPRRRSKETQSSQRQKASRSRPHCSLRPGAVPFVAGMAVGYSHSVRANVQAVLSLLKHHPLSPPSSEPPSEEEELKEILSSLQEELRLMSLEQAALVRRGQAGGAERGDVLRDQERLLLRMERKGAHIAQLHTHTQQIKKLRRVGAAGTAVATRGRSFGACERIKANLTLLKDMRALQKSLRA